MNQIVCDVVKLEDGNINLAETRAKFETLLTKLDARVKEDQSTVAVEVTAFLLTSPGLKTIPTQALIRNLWEGRAERGELKVLTQEQKQEAYSRLEEVLPEYIKSNTDMFHMGRKTGIAIRYVMGENEKEEDGKEDKYDADGNTIQVYRHSNDEWAKITAASEKKAAEKAAAEKKGDAAPDSGTVAAA